MLLAATISGINWGPTRSPSLEQPRRAPTEGPRPRRVRLCTDATPIASAPCLQMDTPLSCLGMLQGAVTPCNARDTSPESCLGHKARKTNKQINKTEKLKKIGTLASHNAHRGPGTEHTAGSAPPRRLKVLRPMLAPYPPASQYMQLTTDGHGHGGSVPRSALWCSAQLRPGARSHATGHGKPHVELAADQHVALCQALAHELHGPQVLSALVKIAAGGPCRHMQRG
jgi:hypothetical protein